MTQVPVRDLRIYFTIGATPTDTRWKVHQADHITDIVGSRSSWSSTMISNWVSCLSLWGRNKATFHTVKITVLIWPEEGQGCLTCTESDGFSISRYKKNCAYRLSWKMPNHQWRYYAKLPKQLRKSIESKCSWNLRQSLLFYQNNAPAYIALVPIAVVRACVFGWSPACSHDYIPIAYLLQYENTLHWEQVPEWWLCQVSCLWPFYKQK